MNQKDVMKPKLRTIFSVILAVLIVAYIASMSMPFIKYTSLVEKLDVRTAKQATWTFNEGEFKINPQFAQHTAGDVDVSLSQYLWFPYKYTDMTKYVFPKAFTAQNMGEYFITSTIATPFFAFIIGLVSILIVLLFKKKSFSVFFPLIWALVSLIGYLTAPIFKFMYSTSYMVQLIIIALTLAVSIAYLIVVMIPQMRYDKQHKEEF